MFSLKTSFLKWAPDYDEAIEHYKKAAQIYINKKQHSAAAEIYLKQDSDYNAAKALEKAGNIYRNLKEYDKMEKMFGRSCLLMRQAGAHDSAIVMLKNVAGDFININMFEKAAKFYEAAADTAVGENKYSEAGNYMNQAAGCYVKMKQYQEAKGCLRKHIDFVILNSQSMGSGFSSIRFGGPHQICGKAVVAIILMELLKDDVIAAQKVQSEAIEKWGFAGTDDADPVSKLLDAIEDEDGEAARVAIQSPTFVNLELHFSRLAKEIPLPAVREQSTASQIKNIPITAGGEEGGPAQLDSDDDIL